MSTLLRWTSKQHLLRHSQPPSLTSSIMATTATSSDHVSGHEVRESLSFPANFDSPSLVRWYSLDSTIQKRIDQEVIQLVSDIRRIGDDGTSVKFGALFDDEAAQQYYEALVGTLKTAKKRGVIKFKGQMLLKGMHDDVVISLDEDEVKKLHADEPAIADEVPIAA